MDGGQPGITPFPIVSPPRYMYTKPQMVEIYITTSMNPQLGKDERTKSPILSSILHIYSNIPSVISLYVEGGMRGEK